MKVIVECLDNQIVSDYCFKGWLGAKNAGHEVELRSLPEISVRQSKFKQEGSMPIGSIGYMEYLFDLYGIEKPLPLQATSNLTAHPSIKQFRVENRGDIIYPSFVKPLLDVKKFTGAVFTKEYQWKLYPELENWDGPYLCSKPFEFDIVAEWRIFVRKGKVVNMSYYDGTNPRVTPDYCTIGYLIEQYKNAPVAYTLDVAVLSSGDTKFIELNDMWAVGPYGCNEEDFFSMLRDRWMEIKYQ